MPVGRPIERSVKREAADAIGPASQEWRPCLVWPDEFVRDHFFAQKGPKARERAPVAERSVEDSDRRRVAQHDIGRARKNGGTIAMR